MSDEFIEKVLKGLDERNKNADTKSRFATVPTLVETYALNLEEQRKAAAKAAKEGLENSI